MKMKNRYLMSMLLLLCTMQSWCQGIMEAVFMEGSDDPRYLLAVSLKSEDPVYALQFDVTAEGLDSLGMAEVVACQPLEGFSVFSRQTMPNAWRFVIVNMQNQPVQVQAGARVLEVRFSGKPGCEGVGITRQYVSAVVGYDQLMPDLYVQTVPMSVTREIVDGEPYGETKQKKYDVLTYKRTFADTEWQPLYVPFSISQEEWEKDFEVAAINMFHQYDEDDNGSFDVTTMEIIRLTGGSTIPNHPYLIRARQQGDKSIVVNNAVLYPAAEDIFTCSSMNTVYSIRGNYSQVSGEAMQEAGCYRLDGGVLSLATDRETPLSPMRWYLSLEPRGSQVINKPQRIRIVVMGIDEDITSILSVGQSDDSSRLYDVGGRAVSDPSRKGVYIRGDRKVLVK